MADFYEPTTDERATDNVVIYDKKVYRDLKSLYENALRNLWRNPDATPYQMATNFGTNGKKHVNLILGLRAAILQVQPTAPISSLTVYGTLTVNGDGTITIDSVA